MNDAVDRTLALLETLARHPGGVPLARLSQCVDLPADDARPLLDHLIASGYVCRVRSDGDYALTTKLSGLGLTFLSRSRVIDVAQPVLERLAERSGELVRLSIVDGDRLPWVARAQGARGGLRYDPEMGIDAQLSCSATGQAWLMTMSDDEARARVECQGLGTPGRFGPNAPATLAEAIERVRAARERGYGLAIESFAAGLNAIAVPVRAKDEPAVAIISLAGPAQRLTEAGLHGLAPAMLEAAAEMAAARGASQLLLRPVAAARQAPGTAA